MSITCTQLITNALRISYCACVYVGGTTIEFGNHLSKDFVHKSSFFAHIWGKNYIQQRITNPYVVFPIVTSSMKLQLLNTHVYFSLHDT